MKLFEPLDLKPSRVNPAPIKEASKAKASLLSSSVFEVCGAIEPELALKLPSTGVVHNCFTVEIILAYIMENNIQEDAMFKFRKMLYQELPNEENEYLDGSDWNEVSNVDFHENFKERLKEEYVESYKELQSMLLQQGMTDIEDGISENQFEELKQEAQDKLINASTLATFYRMYKVFYSITMN